VSQRDSGYDRKSRDLYETPAWVTEVFCRHLWYRNYALGRVWEPAAGSGKMLDHLKKYADGDGACAFGSDIHPLREDIAQVDFLSDGVRMHPCAESVGAIVTNPPYEHATAFIEKALRLFEGRSVGMVAMLLRCDFDHAKSRSHLFRDCPAFKTKLILTRRIMWFDREPGEKGKSPSFNHAWFIWDINNEKAPTLAYGP